MMETHMNALCLTRCNHLDRMLENVSASLCTTQFLKDIGLFCKYLPSNRIHSI